jgi:diguanylate cyclase (GGDEF)-like protein
VTVPGTVLIADDSMVVRAVVRAHLEDAGYRVLEAHDGETALAVARDSSPDLILLDIEMPGLDGHQVLAALKSDDDLRGIPVVFLTNRAGMEDVVAGLNGGAHDYLRKPFEPAELIARTAAATQVKRLQDELRARNEELDRLSRTDSLTGLYNRRHLSEELQRKWRTAVRQCEPLGLLLFDIDHFKQVNDGYGHPAGDRVLVEVGRRLCEQIRAGDVAGRWGGEEFLVVLPRTDLSGAHQLAERIRLAIGADPFVVGEQEISVTTSGGCAAGSVEAVDELITRADSGLYQAKRTGRNRIVAADTSQLVRVPE